MNGFLIKDSNKTGRAGIPHNIGRNKKATVFRIINLEMYKDNLSGELSNHNALCLEENMKRGRESIKGEGRAG